MEVQGLQEDVQLYKEIKFHEGYRDDAEDKPPRYPFDDEVQPPVPESLEVPAAPADASDAAEEVAIGGKDFEPSFWTSFEPHVSVARACELRMSFFVLSFEPLIEDSHCYFVVSLASISYCLSDC